MWQDGELVASPKSHELQQIFEPAADDGHLQTLRAVELVSDFPPQQFIAGVDEVQERIRAGWVYQVNLSHRFHFDASGIDPLACYERLRTANPSPFFGIVEGGGVVGSRARGGRGVADRPDGGTAGVGGMASGDGRWAVVSGSPERLFNVEDGRVTARPIAGTRPRAHEAAPDDALEAEMRADPKEIAEHVMLVDLLRNDLSRVCRPGSVEVSEAFTVERYSHVMHLVSEVCGELPAGGARPDAGGGRRPVRDQGPATLPQRSTSATAAAI